MEGFLRQCADSILTDGTFLLPELTLSFYSEKEPVLLADPKRIPVEECRIHEDGLRLISGGKPLLVAVNPDDETAERLMGSDVSALAVTVDPADNIKEQLVDGFINKSWLYNLYAHKVFRWFLEAADKLVVITQGEHQRVSDCPIQARVFQGKPYANRKHDCISCMFCVDASEPEALYCTGRQRIATVEDFKRTLEERKSLYDEFLQPDKTEMVKAGICPHCGGRLEERKGESGIFLGCSHYPFCHFTAEKKPGGGVSFSF